MKLIMLISTIVSHFYEQYCPPGDDLVSRKYIIQKVDLLFQQVLALQCYLGILVQYGVTSKVMNTLYLISGMSHSRIRELNGIEIF